MNDISLDNFVLQTEVALTNALQYPEILSALTAYNMGADKIQPMAALLTTLKSLISKQKAEYGDQYEATQALNEAWELARVAYMRDLKLARILFEGNADAAGSLLLSGDRKRSLAGALEQARIFYDNLLSKPALLQTMLDNGRSLPALTANQALITATYAAKARQESERGEAQQATQERDKVLDELAAFMSKFHQIADLALEEHPQWLERLGFLKKG